MPVSFFRGLLLVLGIGCGALLSAQAHGQIPGSDSAAVDSGAVSETGSEFDLPPPRLDFAPVDSAAASEADSADLLHGTVRVDPPRPEEIQVPYVPTPMRVVDEMLEIADVGPGDVVYDLGSGDGRIVLRAAEKYGARAVGYELDSALVAQARREAREKGIADRVTFHREDLFRADLSEATVVTLYLLRSLNLKLRPKLLRELEPGDRVVSHDFDMKDWEPEEVTDMFAHRVYLWRIPEEIPDHLRSETSD